jgi:hypothetical protein
MTLEGAALSFQERAEFSSEFTILSGQLDLVGENADFILSGNFTPGDLV